ncbi:MAG: hypothetical protein PVF51_12255 [Nitrospirota bacterium]|jgi:hypothetical protein
MNQTGTIARNPQRRLLILGVLLLLATAVPARAVSTLFLDGALGFTAATDRIQIDGALTGAAGVVPAPVVAGSHFHLAAVFGGVSADNGITTATFGTAPGAPDVSVIGGGDTLLLAGELQSLSAVGVNGVDSAILTGQLALTDGSLMAMFANTGGVMDLQLDLSAPYRPGIFNRDFAGHVNGRLESVSGPAPDPEPFPEVTAAVPEASTALLMTVGLLGLSVFLPGRSRRAAMSRQESAGRY